MKRHHRGPLAGIAILSAAALIAGCGGSDDSDRLSADELRTQADAICAEYDTATDAIAAPTDEAGAVPFLEQSRDAMRDALEQLRALEPPEDLQASWDRALALQQEQLDAAEEAISRIEGGESAEDVLDELGPQLEQRSNELSAIADELGLTVCGQEEGGEDGPATTTDTLDPVPPGTDGDTGAGTGEAGSVDQYVADVQQTAGALQAFGTLLQGISSPEELAGKSAEAQGHLDDFDAGIEKLDSYTLENDQLEAQRAALVAEGPNVSSVLRQFVDAAAAGDTAQVQALLPDVLTALQNFSNAANARS
jgi:hypothetical protein